MHMIASSRYQQESFKNVCARIAGSKVGALVVGRGSTLSSCPEMFSDPCMKLLTLCPLPCDFLTKPRHSPANQKVRATPCEKLGFKSKPDTPNPEP